MPPDAPSLFDDAEPSTEAPAFTLWHRVSRRHKWEPVAHTTTEFEAAVAIGTGGRHGGMWLILPTGQQP